MRSVACWLAVVLLSLVAAGTEITADENYQAAIKLINSQQYGAALTLLNTILAENPAALEALYAAGFAAEKTGDAKTAITHYSGALQVALSDDELPEAEAKIAARCRDGLGRLSPASLVLLKKADELQAEVGQATNERERTILQIAANDLRQVALGSLEVVSHRKPEAKAPPTAEPVAGAVGVEQALGYKLSGLKRVKEHDDARKFKSHWYKLFPQKCTWHQAQERCREMGGYLACITTKEEQDFVAAMVGRPAVFIGGTDEVEEGTWTWVTGEPFAYTNWAPGEPSNSKRAEHYLTILPSAFWNDNTIAKRTVGGFVCEWEK